MSYWQRLHWIDLDLQKYLLQALVFGQHAQGHRLAYNSYSLGRFGKHADIDSTLEDQEANHRSTKGRRKNREHDMLIFMLQI